VSACPRCGKENLQTDGSFCAFCGTTLNNSTKAVTKDPGAPTSTLQVSQNGEATYDMQRLEKVIRRVERLGYVVGAELFVLLALIVLLMFTFNII
jgi:uncharacterized membrane protein YvbJ